MCFTDDHRETLTFFKGTPSAVINNFITAFHEVKVDEILKQTVGWDFWYSNELFSLLMYIHDGTVKEGLVRFTDVCANRHSDGVLELLQNVVFTFL